MNMLFSISCGYCCNNNNSANCKRSSTNRKSISSSSGKSISNGSRLLLSMLLCFAYSTPPSRSSPPLFAIAFVGAIPNYNNNNNNRVAPTARLFGVERGGSIALNKQSNINNNNNNIISEEEVIPTNYIAESDLPTDMGAYRLRAYRVSSGWTSSSASTKNHSIIANGGTTTINGSAGNIYHDGLHFGKEPCVIYYAEKPPGTLGGEGGTNAIVTSASMVEGVPIRIHDQCFTSEVFRSQRCDCKEQLQMSLHYIQEHGGAIIYLQQEGRGIGLANKVAAYALQDSGMDTVDANIHLGFPEDARQYGMVPSILKNMGINSIKLMTNNPKKTQRLRALGVKVDDIIPMVIKSANKHNRKYLETKVVRMNHTDIGAMLLLPDNAANTINTTAISSTTTTVIRKNGIMAPHKKSKSPNQADQLQQQQLQEPNQSMWIYEGATKAAKAVAQALLDEQEAAKRTGVSAREDGYCFGKQSVEDAIAAVQRGEMVVVVDDENRENEGDFIIPASKVTPEIMATMVRYSSGVVCVAMESQRLLDLEINQMVTDNQDPKGTAFGVSVDAKQGISTGISATDRAITIQLLANPKATAKDFSRPGHIFPLRAREGGTFSRDGHTEASVDLSKLAGLYPCGVLCEIVSEENPVEMARLPELRRFCKTHGYILTSIVDIAQYRRDMEQHPQERQQEDAVVN